MRRAFVAKLAQFGNVVAVPDAARDDQGTQFRIRREDSVEADQVQPRPRHQGGETLQEADRRHLERSGAAAPGRLEREGDALAAIPVQLVIRESRARDVTA